MRSGSEMALSLLGAKLVLVLVLVLVSATYSTGDIPHRTTRSSWYHGEIPKICPRICISTADPDFYVDDTPTAHNTFVSSLLWAILPFFGRSIVIRVLALASD